MMEARKLILYIACSLDGIIAKPNDDLSFLEKVNREGEDYGYGAFMESVDAIIMGRKTYDWVVGAVGEYPNKNIQTFIVTRSPRPAEGNITFYSGNLKELVSNLKSKPGKNIFCDGGAEIVNEFLREKLFDELIVSIIPTLLGDGTRLFTNDFPEQTLELISSKPFESGLLQVHYKIVSK